MTENDQNQQPQYAAGNSRYDTDSSDGEFSGFGFDSAGSDIEMNSKSSVSSVHTAELTDFNSGPSDGESECEADIAANRQVWSVNDRANVQKQPFGGPQPGLVVILGPDDNEFDFFKAIFPSVSD